MALHSSTRRLSRVAIGARWIFGVASPRIDSPSRCRPRSAGRRRRPHDRDQRPQQQGQRSNRPAISPRPSPSSPMDNNSSGTPAMAPSAGAHDGRRHRAALVALGPRRHRRGDAGHGKRRPAEAQQHEAGIELPGRGDLADQRHAHRHAGEPQQQHGSRPQAVDGAAHDALDARTHEEEHGDGRRHLGDRPACGRRHRLRGRRSIRTDPVTRQRRR